MKQIFLVDDHVIIRNGLKELVERLGPYKVSGEFDNGKEVVDYLPHHPLPDLIIMDLSMPEMDGDEVMLVLKEKNIKVPVLMLTLNTDEDRLVRLFRRGVRGYLQKNCTAAMLKEAIEEIFACGFYHNEHMEYAMDAPMRPKAAVARETFELLSPKERQFLKLICHEDEYTYKQISDIMGISPRTVDGYRETVFAKFGLKSKTGMVLFAMRNNLLDKL